MNGSRWWRHLLATRRALDRAFTPTVLTAIEGAIATSERTHRGEIRFAIESSLDPHRIWSGTTPRARAMEVFAALGVWDTTENNGVLIYVLLADRDVEIVADRGYNLRVTSDQWTDVCHAMERHFAAGDYGAASVQGVHQVGELIAAHFPPLPGGRDEDELPNRPALL
jgi:uncharacterized membrane protein YgcG